MSVNKGKCTQGLAEVAMFFILVFLAGCAEDPGSATDPNLTTFEEFTPRSSIAPLNPDSIAAAELVQPQNALAIQFFQYTNRGVENTSDATNGVVAGYGLSQTLAMLAAGARGTTAAEFPAGLDASVDPEVWSEGLYALNQQVGAGTGFALRNAVWGQTGYRFLADYLNILAEGFEADLTAYAFKPVSEGQLGSTGDIPVVILGGSYAPTGAYWSLMDDWATALTIPNNLDAYSVSQNDPDRTRLAFANSSTLAGDWPMAQTPADSVDGLFESFEGLQYWVPMLRQQGTFGFYQDELLSAVELPLGVGDQSLLLITPSAGNYASVFSNLAQHLNALTGLLMPTEMETFIPEFSFTDAGVLDGFLGSLGFDEVYLDDYPGCTEQCGPDFSGINGQGFLRLASVTRRAALSFSSEAVNATSITAAVMEATQTEPASVWDGYPVSLTGGSGSVSGLTITAGGGCSPTYIPAGDTQVRPFIFIVRDSQTGTILYLGQLTDAGGTEAGSWVCL